MRIRVLGRPTLEVPPPSCSRSPTSITFSLLEREFEFHIDAQDKTFPIQQTALKIQWLPNSQYAALPSDEKQKSLKYLNKLYQYNITTIHQAPTSIISKEEFNQKYKALP